MHPVPHPKAGVPNACRHVRRALLAASWASLLVLGLTACGGGGGGSSGGEGTTTANTLTAPAVQVQHTGENYTFSIASTTSGLTYQWQRSANGGTTWSSVGGSFTQPSAYAFVADDLSMNGDQYRLFVTDGAHTGSSAPYTLTVTASAPTIQRSPQNQSIILGTNAVFSVSASGASRTYRWQTSNDLTSWQDVTGTTATLTVVRPTAQDNGRFYRVVITTSLGTVTSDVATLTVQSPIANAYILHETTRSITRLSVMFDGSIQLAMSGNAPEATTLAEAPINATLSPTGDTLVVNSGLTFTALQFDSNGALVDRWGAKTHTRSSPFAFAFSPDGQGVYAITGGYDIGQYQLTSNGLAPMTPGWSSSQPAVSGFVGPGGTWLVAAEAFTGKLTTYAINADRTLSATPSSASAALGSISRMTANATGTRAYAALYSNSIAQLSVDTAGNIASLTPATVTGSGIGQPVLTGDGKCLFSGSYIAPPNRGQVASFRIAGDGTLSASVPARVTSDVGLSAIAVTPDSRYLIAVHDGTGYMNGQYGSGFAVVYSIGTLCELTQLGGSQLTGSSKPVDIVVR